MNADKKDRVMPASEPASMLVRATMDPGSALRLSGATIF
jgi:hypothetical protein